MKKHNEEMDLATIERYWGSLEAYQEEQRRTALVRLENLAVDNKVSVMWSRRPRTTQRNPAVAQRRAAGGSFRLFGRTR